MMKQDMIVFLLLPLVATNLFDLQKAYGVGEENRWTVVQYDEGPCTLHEPGKRMRLWFGQQLTLKCSFQVYSHSSYPILRWIDAGGIVVNENGDKPRYYAHHTAFFDSEDNLIACGGDVLLDKRVGHEPETRRQDFPIPEGCELTIAKYKSAFYESDRIIGIRATEPLVTSDLPKGKRDLRKTLKIDTEHRTLLRNPPPGVHTYTVDGACTVQSRSKKGTENPFVLIGDLSHSQAKIYFRTDESKDVSVYYSLTNYTEFNTHQDLYACFFDDEGHLIASTWLRECHTRPKETTPSVKVIESNGFTFKNLSALSNFSAQLPLDEYKKISNYKMTMYVYDTAKRSSK